MIVNDRCRFAFVHIQKTAGTSVSDALSRIPGTTQFGPRHNFVAELPLPNRYFKFAFVRNPWDRLYSWYNMMVHKGGHNTFSKYLLSNSKNFSEFLDCTEVIVEKNPMELVRRRQFGSFEDDTVYNKSLSFNQLDYISDEKGFVAVDFIGRFESLQADFSHVLHAVGVADITLPTLNKFEHDDYRNYYTTTDVDKVAKLYKRDIEFFGYKFEI